MNETLQCDLFGSKEVVLRENRRRKLVDIGGNASNCIAEIKKKKTLHQKTGKKFNTHFTFALTQNCYMISTWRNQSSHVEERKREMNKDRSIR